MSYILARSMFGSLFIISYIFNSYGPWLTFKIWMCSISWEEIDQILCMYKILVGIDTWAKSWRAILDSGCVCSSVRSRTVHARVLKFHIWIPHGKIFEPRFFFLSELSTFLELRLFEKIQMKSDACHILWTVHARVLKFHIWIPHGEIADPYYFSCLGYLPFWSYAPLKNSEWNLVSKISRKVFELGTWNLVSW